MFNIVNNHSKLDFQAHMEFYRSQLTRTNTASLFCYVNVKYMRITALFFHRTIAELPHEVVNIPTSDSFL